MGMSMSYSFDNISLLRDGVRWFPTMGEIHYSRVPCAYWEETLNKMKAGGVDIVSAYVIWIHHEEIEGCYDWTGSRNLRAFCQTAEKNGIKIWLRIGPWSHGEVRNGGFPDWLLKKDFALRTNDERYFAVVENWYTKIYEQVKGYICNPEDSATREKPIIGVQIENEFGHVGGLYDESGDEHMKRLQAIAKKVGFTVALYTATGWGGARTGGMLPVMGGYCDAPWDQRITELEPSGNYVFTLERNDHNIGSDHGFGYGITFDITKFPYLTAELGGGLQVTSHRRTIATAHDIAAVALTKIGSGCNLVGYYMYAGGTNPDGKLSTLQESRETGYPNDLPVKSYDFRAPVREFGVVSDTLRELKLLSYFAHDFGSELCALPAVIPEDNPQDPTDTAHLRYAYRSDGERGYLFVNNYVRHKTLSEHRALQLSSPDGKTPLPVNDVLNGQFFFLPFNMSFGGINVKTARATPFCTIGKPGEEQYKVVFYKRDFDQTGKDWFTFADEESAQKAKKHFLLLARHAALNMWKSADGSRLYCCEPNSFVRKNADGRDVVTGRGETAYFSAYPHFKDGIEGWFKDPTHTEQQDGSLNTVLFHGYERKSGATCGAVTCSEKSSAQTASGDGVRTYALDLSSLARGISGDLSDCFVTFTYTGESARLYAVKDGKRTLLLDHFYLGEDYPWEIGLKRFTSSGTDLSQLELDITPLKKDAKIYLEKWPEMQGESAALLHGVTYEYEWSYVL